MLSKYSPLYVVIIIVLVFNVSNGEINTSINLGGGYNGNIFNDSLATEDSYSIIGGNIDYYPSSSVQLSAFGQYRGYKTNNDLSNIYGGGSIKIIPTSELSPVALVFSGDISHQKFGSLYNLYDQNMIGADALLIYRITPKFHINSKVSYSDVSYINSDYGSRSDLGFYGGVNFTPFGTNSINFSSSYYNGRYVQMPLESDSSPGGRNNRGDNYDNYSLTDISLRYSRPIGQRTGLSLTVGRRYIQYDQSFFVTDFDIDNLSPIADLWDGPSASVFVKHFFDHQYTLVLKGSYAEKEFIETVEYGSDGTVLSEPNSRSDSFSSVMLTLSKPITIGSGDILTPSVSVNYLSNSSTDNFYDYSGLSGSLTMSIKF